MNPERVVRSEVKTLTDLPNVGPAIAGQLATIGIRTPAELRGREPLELFEALCARSGRRLDPCLLDVLLSIADFIDGGDPIGTSAGDLINIHANGGLVADEDTGVLRFRAAVGGEPEAIKRVEILRDGASAQYGSDAIAGVVNVILDDAREWVRGEGCDCLVSIATEGETLEL